MLSELDVFPSNRDGCEVDVTTAITPYVPSIATLSPYI
jgi:hypothetical protein